MKKLLWVIENNHFVPNIPRQILSTPDIGELVCCVDILPSLFRFCNPNKDRKHMAKECLARASLVEECFGEFLQMT